MLEKLLKRPAAIARRRAGVLGPYLDSFLVAATELGYTTIDATHSVVGAGRPRTVAQTEASGTRGTGRASAEAIPGAPTTARTPQER